MTQPNIKPTGGRAQQTTAKPASEGARGAPTLQPGEWADDATARPARVPLHPGPASGRGTSSYYYSSSNSSRAAVPGRASVLLTRRGQVT